MTNTDKVDQSYAEANAALDELIKNVTESLDRKRERHGEKFDPAQAAPDFYNRLHKIPNKIKTVLLATALQRLATIDADDPFAEIADLDFDFDPAVLTDDDNTKETEE